MRLLLIQRSLILARLVVQAPGRSDSCACGTPEKLDTHADVTLDKVGAGFEITRSQLSVVAKIPGVDRAKFEEIANRAKAGCPVSKRLNAKITMDAKLEA